jgi:hypothetical protein
LSRLGQDNGYTLRCCIYDEDKQKSLIAPILETIINRWRADPPSLKFDEPFWSPGNDERAVDAYRKLNELHNAFDRWFGLTATICKNPAFEEEREWRLVSNEYDPRGRRLLTKFREGKAVLIPYASFKIDLATLEGEDQVTEVICGPSPELELAQKSALDLLLNHGWPGVSSKQSRVPYRDW